MFPATLIGQSVRPAASLYAVVRLPCAVAAVGSLTCCVPMTVPGPKPVTAVPGLTPRSPVIDVGPVLVTVEPASTTKAEAAPSAIGAWPHAAVVKVHV